MRLIEVIGYIPVIVFPVASLIQLYQLYQSKSAVGLSTATWIAFAIGNLSLYIYTEKYFEPQAIITLLGTFCVQVVVVLYALYLRKAHK
jgi:uncharacterized protein with PQ loop repeat